AQLASQLPAAQLKRPIWITARGSITVDPGEPGVKQGRAYITLTEFTLGKQPVGAWPVYIVMGPTGVGLLRWAVPGAVRDVEIEDKRLVIRTRLRAKACLAAFTMRSWRSYSTSSSR